MSYDAVICNARVYDGTGNPSYKKDVGIRDGKIVSIGATGKEKADRIIDAAGLVLCPGFIDIHNHVDMSAPGLPFLESHTMQGVTTSISGNCGLSMAPLGEATKEQAQKYLSPFIPKAVQSDWKWNSMGEFLARLEKSGLAHNVAVLAGQGSIRIAVKGFDPSPATPEEMGKMKALLRAALEEGAFGMSSGLIYPPGSFTSDEELTELASVLAEYKALYATHMRSEGSGLIESVEASLALARKWDIPLEISHHKATGRYNWGKVHRTLRMMEMAREEGVDVCCDVYPYTAGSSTITALLPPFAMEGGIDSTLVRLADPEARARMIRELKITKGGWENLLADAGFENVLICAAPDKSEMQGKTLAELIAAYPKKYEKDSSYEVFFDLLLDMRCNATMAIFCIEEEEMGMAVTHPLASVASDAWGTSPALGGRPHPRAYGTFPRFLRNYVLDSGKIPLETGIRKMTSLPASRIGLADRGVIKAGCHADLVLFDPRTIRDKATYADPHQYPEGIEMVMVSGTVIAEKGKLTGEKPGRILRRGQ